MLVREGRSIVCTGGAKRHTYDVAKEGYVNLLPPGKGKNAHTGDDSAMVRARVSFLATGTYGRISDGVADIIAEGVQDGHLVIVDAGCGEGYHSCRYTKRLAEGGRQVLLAAFDASKHASAAGAKLSVREGIAPKEGVLAPFDGNAHAMFMTGNIFSLPIADESADAVVSMFAPIAWEENRRILKKGGVLVAVASGEDHLLEMRRIIYDEVIKKAPDIAAGEGFELVRREEILYEAQLDSSETIMALFGMTPFAYKTSREAAERLAALESLGVSVNAEVFVFRKIC